MALPFIDPFTGGPDDPLSGAWTVDGGVMLLNSAGTMVVGGSGSHNFALVTGETFPDDQYAQCNAYPDPLQACGPRVRGTSASGGTGYILDLYEGVLYVQKMTGGGATLTTIATLGSASPGDLLYLQAVGAVLSAHVNGFVAGGVTDGTFATGAAGMHAYLPSLLDNYEAGAIGGGGGGGPVVSMLPLLGAG